MNPKAIGLMAVTVSMLLANQAVAANAQYGERLAKQWCASCHVVSPSQTHGNTEAPPFSAIADLPNFNAAKVALFLLNPHPPMKGLNLSRSEAADLAAYIEAQAGT